jgi:membrane-bound serine protease (ClpP class)
MCLASKRHVQRGIERWALSLIALIPALVLLWGGASTAAPAPAPVVLVVPIEGTIDLGMGPFVERALREAAEGQAVAVVLDVNTLGGRVDAAVAIRDQLLGSPVPTVAFINPRAISAGALLALAAEKIVVAGGATMGAATPVLLGSDGVLPQPVEEKTLSYVRKEFRATADARGRPGLIAEAMVDPDVAIEGVVPAGKLLTLTTDEALELKVADFRADSLPAALAELGWANADLRRLEMNWAERVVRFITQPVLASLLMTLGVLGLVVELRTPGLGVPGLVGVLSLVTFFWGHALVRLVGWEQIALVVAGLLLLVLEVFVIPGFGLAGVLGLLALALGLGTSLIGDGASWRAAAIAGSRVAASVALAAVISLVAFRYLPRLPGAQKLVLGRSLQDRTHSVPAHDVSRASLLGVSGTSLTPLRPAGTASLGGLRVDVVSEGEFIESGEHVEVVRDEGLRVVVKRRPAAEKEGLT